MPQVISFVSGGWDLHSDGDSWSEGSELCGVVFVRQLPGIDQGYAELAVRISFSKSAFLEYTVT